MEQMRNRIVLIILQSSGAANRTDTRFDAVDDGAELAVGRYQKMDIAGDGVQFKTFADAEIIIAAAVVVGRQNPFGF
jgi:hypothetical protein